MTKEVLRCPQAAGVIAVSPDAPITPGMPACRAELNEHGWEYMQQLPGRLRVRTAALKRNPNRTEALEEILKSIEGVSTAAVSAVTGSVTAIYNPKLVTPAAILGVLRNHGVMASGRWNGAKSAALNHAGRAVLYLVLERVVARPVETAFAALL